MWVSFAGEYQALDTLLVAPVVCVIFADRAYLRLVIVWYAYFAFKYEAFTPCPERICFSWLHQLVGKLQLGVTTSVATGAKEGSDLLRRPLDNKR